MVLAHYRANFCLSWKVSLCVNGAVKTSWNISNSSLQGCIIYQHVNKMPLKCININITFNRF